MTLKPQLQRLESPEAIRTNLLVPVQQGVARLQGLVTDAEKRIEEIRRLVAGPAGKGTAPTHSARLSPVQHKYQPIKGIDAVKREMDASAIPIVRSLREAIDLAEEYRTRHWSIRAMLRLAKPDGLAVATALRAHYSQILAKAGQVELAAWAQAAIDSVDVRLMDSVIRENDARKRDERAFLSPGVLELFGNVWEEYRLAQAILTEVVLTAQKGGLIYAEFQKGTGQVAINRIALGLSVANARNDYDLDEDGSIVFKQPDNNERLDTVGVKLRQMTKK